MGASAIFPNLAVSHTLPASSSVLSADLIAVVVAVYGIGNSTSDVYYTIFFGILDALSRPCLTGQQEILGLYHPKIPLLGTCEEEK